MNFDHINTIPRDLPRRGPAKWSKAADRDCPCRRYWLADYRNGRTNLPGAETSHGGWHASKHKGRPTAMICPYRDPFSAYEGRSMSRGHLRAVRRWAAHLKSKRKSLP